MSTLHITQAILDALKQGSYPNLTSYDGDPKKWHDQASVMMAATLASAHNEQAVEWMIARTPEEGKYIEQAKANSANVNLVTALTGDPEYVRPNGEKYFPRQWGVHQDVMVMRKARENQQYIFLEGEPGCGKTAALEAAFGDDMISVAGSVDLTMDDLVGSFIKDDKGNLIWVDGPLIIAMREGKVLYLDEIGLIDSKVLSLVYPLMDGRDELLITLNPTLGVLKPAPGFFVVGATNPKAPGVRLSEALLSRFRLRAEYTTDYALAQQMLNIPTDIIRGCINLAKRMRQGEVKWAPQMRELIAYRQQTDLFGEQFAMQNLLAQAPATERAAVRDAIGQRFGENGQAARI